MRGKPRLVITLIIMDYYEFSSLAGIKLEQMDSYSKLSITLILTKKPKTIKFEEIPSKLKEIVIGLALGDLHIRRRHKAWNTCLCFKQSMKNEPYALHL